MVALHLGLPWPQTLRTPLASIRSFDAGLADAQAADLNDAPLPLGRAVARLQLEGLELRRAGFCGAANQYTRLQ